MKTLQQFTLPRTWLLLLAIATLCTLTPSLAHAQSSGPLDTIDVCSNGLVDYDNSIEQTICIYGYQSQLYSDVETDTDWADVNEEDDYDVMGVLSGLALYANVTPYQLYEGTATPIDVVYGDGYNEDATASITPQENVTYTLLGLYNENYCPGWYGECQFQGWNDGLYTTATVTPPPPSYQGYIDPKYIVLGVTYAPPGPASSVTYTNSTTMGTTNSLINTASSGTSYTVSISNSIGIGGWKVGTSVGSTTAATQTTKDTQTTTLNWATTDTLKTYGTPTAIVGGSYTSPVDHDYDTIYVWLNPVEVFSLSASNIVWNGYGYDANDQNGMEVVPIALGYLNGDFGPMPSGLLFSTNRAWAANQIYASGQSAALDSNDFAAIAQADPFSNTSYGANEIGYVPPTPNTPDNRFTISACNNSNSISFDQSDPSQSAPNYTCTLSYSNMNSNALAYTNSSTNTYSLDRSYSGSIFSNDLTIDFKAAYTTTTATEVDSSVSSTQSTSATLNTIGLPCNNSQPYVGPCVPVYSGPPQLPTEFMIYQDNLYGTFFAAPLYYY